MIKSESVHGSEGQVLEGLEVVRHRPALFIGTSDKGGVLQLLWEVLDNAVDLYLARCLTEIRIDIRDGWFEIEDDGPGFPIGYDRLGRDTLEQVFTRLHTGSPTRDRFVSVHLCESYGGHGLPVVNALSIEFEVETHTRGRCHRMKCRQGRVVEGPIDAGASTKSGARLRFRPDPEIFDVAGLDRGEVRRRLSELAHLCPALTLRLGGETFRERRGIVAWIEAKVEGPCFSACGTVNDVVVDVALGWGKPGPHRLLSFVGGHATLAGGAHVDGLWSGLREAVYAGEGQRPELQRFKAAFGNGLLAVVNASFAQPRFAGTTRAFLESRKAAHAVETLVARALPAWSHWQSSVGLAIKSRAEAQ